jgi:hypothetical protein
MTRIYENRGFSRRMTGSAIVCGIALLFGCYDFWRAIEAPPGQSGYSYLFAAFFIFGGIYGFRQIERDFADTVIALDADGGNARIALWRPLGAKRIEGPLSALTGWRREIRTPRRNVSVDTLVADHPNHPRPLLFEMGKGVVATDAFRALTPAAASATHG